MTQTALCPPPPSSAADRPPPRRRVLLVSYTFPPVGGAGVQRVAKLAKFLPRCGWDVTVLTTANPSVPLFDQSLLDDVGSAVTVRRARTWEPGYGMKAAVAGGDARPASAAATLKAWVKGSAKRAATTLLQPDVQVLWKHNAVREGLAALHETPHDAILASAPPFSTFLIGRDLSRRTGVPLIVDYRDEWDLSNQYWENKQLDRFSQAIQQRMQRGVLRTAAAVVATTQASTNNLRDACRRAGSAARVECVYNGFDPEDFTEARSFPRASAADGLVRVAYVGTLWKLTTIEPVVQAFRRLSEIDPPALARLRLVFAGRATPPEQALLDQLRGLGPCLEERGYVDHAEAIRVMAAADQLCVILADLPGAHRVLPAKLFEYLAIDRPILAVAPRGELWDILSRFPRSQAFEPRDVEGLARGLQSLVRSLGHDHPAADPAAAAPFERQSQAQRMADVLAAVLQPASASPP